MGLAGNGFSQAEHATSPKVWVAIGVVMAGSVLSAIGLIEWVWIMFWVGVALMVGGSLASWAAGIMDQVSEFGSGDPDPGTQD